MMCDKKIFTKSKNKIDSYLYPDKTVYKYLSELNVSDENTSCAMTKRVKTAIEKILVLPL